MTRDPRVRPVRVIRSAEEIQNRLPGGSYSNGAAIRVAPVALAFFPNPADVARAAEAQAEVTGHTHPVGIFGARLQALAVLRAVWKGAWSEAYDPENFIESLQHSAPDEFQAPLEWIASHVRASVDAAVKHLGTGGRASSSVAIAFWAFASCVDDPEHALVRAVNLGGDSDSIGAMAGALVGAYHGACALPARLVEALENGEKGRDYVMHLADRLLEGWQLR